MHNALVENAQENSRVAASVCASVTTGKCTWPALARWAQSGSRGVKKPTFGLTSMDPSPTRIRSFRRPNRAKLLFSEVWSSFYHGFWWFVIGFHGVFMVSHALWSRNARVLESKLMVWPDWQEPTKNAYFGKDFTDSGVQKAVFSRLRRLRIATESAPYPAGGARCVLADSKYA